MFFSYFLALLQSRKRKHVSDLVYKQLYVPINFTYQSTLRTNQLRLQSFRHSFIKSHVPRSIMFDLAQMELLSILFEKINSCVQGTSN